MSKVSKLKTVIRRIVREEVALAIGEVINELKKPTQQVSKPKYKKKVVEGKRKYQKFTENSVLNDVLNETAASDEWKTMGGETYDSGKMNQVMSSQYGDLMNAPAGEVNADAMVASMGVQPEAAPEAVKNIFTKDYRAIMKAVDKKRGK